MYVAYSLVIVCYRFFANSLCMSNIYITFYLIEKKLYKKKKSNYSRFEIYSKENVMILKSIEKCK